MRPHPAGEVIGALLDVARPGLEAHGDWDDVNELVARILADGNGADHQRRAAQRGGRRNVIAHVVERTLP